MLTEKAGEHQVGYGYGLRTRGYYWGPPDNSWDNLLASCEFAVGGSNYATVFRLWLN